MNIPFTKKWTRVVSGIVLALACSMSPFLAKDAAAYGTLSRADCGFLGVMESVTYTVFPSEFGDWLDTWSHAYVRDRSATYWTFYNQYHSGWSNIRAYAGEWFATNYNQIGYVYGWHYYGTGGPAVFIGMTSAGDCNISVWY
jgi:hypothetical protein